MRKKIPFRKFNVVSALKKFAPVAVLTNKNQVFLKVIAGSPLVKLAWISVLSLIFCLIRLQAYGQAQLIKDVNLTEERFTNEYSNLIYVGESMYFISMGRELWKTNGTAGGTARIKTFASIYNMMAIGNIIYIVASDGKSGQELWKTNGTSGGTLLVKDVRSGSAGSQPRQLTNVNGVLYFVANNGNTGNELWKSDGTSPGTVLVKDIVAGSSTSNPTWLANVNGTVYFSASNNVHGPELWKSDGTSAGTVMVKDILTGANRGSSPQLLTNLNGVLYFTAIDNISGRELWKSNGTAAGTVRVKDILPGAASSGITQMAAIESEILFNANDGKTGMELWKSNGTTEGTTLVLDMNEGPYDTWSFDNFTSLNGNLYFTASYFSNEWVWRSNGTAEGTYRLAEWHKQAEEVPRFAMMNGNLYFFSGYFNEEDSGYIGLYSMGSDGSVELIRSLYYNWNYSNPTRPIYRPELVVAGNTLFFYGILNQFDGYKLLKSDGTSNGTQIVKDVYEPTEGSNPDLFVNLNNVIYFRAANDLWRTELWRTDGTAAGTYVVRKMRLLNFIETVNDKVIFHGENNSGVPQLWKTDGTPSGSVVLKSIPAENPAIITNMNNLLLFSSQGALWRSDATPAGTIKLKDLREILLVKSAGTFGYVLVKNSTFGLELWRSDGTSNGTLKIKTIRDGNAVDGYQSPRSALVNTIFYFQVNDGVHGLEIWRTDGTSSGTYLLTDLRTGDDNDLANDLWKMTSFKGELYFSAMDQSGIYALYKSNGTAEGTIRLMSMYAIQAYIPYGDKLLIFPGGNEIWTTDGTVEGTVKLKKIADYPNSRLSYKIVNGIIYVTLDSYGGKYVWRTDGTECGTIPFSIGADDPYPIESIGNNLILGAFDTFHGKEPYRYNSSLAPQSPCGLPTIASSEGQAEISSDKEIITSYPNPFNNEFLFRINGADDGIAQIEIVTSSGQVIENISGLRCNADHSLGSSWPKGMYIMRINTGNKLLSQKVFKK